MDDIIFNVELTEAELQLINEAVSVYSSRIGLNDFRQRCKNIINKCNSHLYGNVPEEK